MIPGRSLKSVRLASPLITRSTASRLQSGQSDSVRLGTPVAIGTRSQLLGSGLGAQVGWGNLPCGKIELMCLPKDHVAFEIDRKRLAVWADIRHLQWGFAQGRDCRKLRQHGRTLQRKWLPIFYIGLRALAQVCHLSSDLIHHIFCIGRANVIRNCIAGGSRQVQLTGHNFQIRATRKIASPGSRQWHFWG